jgi:hypothetical protein
LQGLDGHVAVEMSIEGPVDLAHPALADFGFNPVMAKDLANHWFSSYGLAHGRGHSGGTRIVVKPTFTLRFFVPIAGG